MISHSTDYFFLLHRKYETIWRNNSGLEVIQLVIIVAQIRLNNTFVMPILLCNKGITFFKH